MMKMKKLCTNVLAILLSFMMLFILTACGEQTLRTPVAVAVIMGNHANAKAPNLASPAIEKMILAATSSNGLISVINLDGSPQLVNGWLISSPQASLSKSQLNKIAAKQAQEVLSNLAAVKAQSPEVDTLSALATAVRSLASAPQGSSKNIIIFDTGLSTTGILNFTKSDFINASADIVADYLYQQQEIPNFFGANIMWLGLGDTAAPQTALSGAQKNNLQQIWTKIIEKTDGKVTFSDVLPGGDIPAKDYPKVSTVSLLNNLTTAFDNSGPVAFTEKQIRFIGDSADFVDPAAAKAVLSPIADYMKQNPQFNALLVGTTAGQQNQNYCLQLSAARAEVVRNTIISLGVPADQITAIGLGFSDPYHIPDANPDGTLNEAVAVQNRKVLLLDTTSEDAQSILAKNDFAPSQ